ncbi:MAG: DUF3800 domain-containing protein [Terriglobia bacterium]
MWQAAAYFDESDDNDRAYAVAGFLGHQHDCVHLHWEWEERLLKKYELKYFKASELECGKGQFAKFRDNADPKKLDAKFSEREKELFRQIKTESINIILEFTLIQGFGAVLMLPDYHRLRSEYEAIGKTLPDPYFLCAQLVMMEAGFIMNAINDRPDPSQHGLVRPVFDSHEQYSGRAKQMFDFFMEKNPLSSQCLLPPQYEDEKRYLMLQAADNFAYEARRLLITQEYDKHIPERMAMTRLKERVFRIYKLNYDALRMIMDNQTPDVLPIKAEIENQMTL